MNEEPVKAIGAMWWKISKSGIKYLSGVITVDGVEQRIVCFENTKKTNEKAPDWNIMKSTPMGQ